MASVNKVILIGHAGRDCELRSTPNGAAVATVRLATSRQWKGRDSGERVEETEWHSVVLYDRQAEVAGEYVKKGRLVYIEGRLKTRKWQDKDGNDRYTTEIVAEVLQLLGAGDRNTDVSGSRESTAARAAPTRQGHARPPSPDAARATARASTAAMSSTDFDDDAPF